MKPSAHLESPPAYRRIRGRTLCLGATLLACYMLLTFGDAAESLLLHIASRTWEDVREVLSILIGIPFLYYGARLAHLKLRAIYADSTRCPICAASLADAFHRRDPAVRVACSTTRQASSSPETPWHDAN